MVEFNSETHVLHPHSGVDYRRTVASTDAVAIFGSGVCVLDCTSLPESDRTKKRRVRNTSGRRVGFILGALVGSEHTAYTEDAQVLILSHRHAQYHSMWITSYLSQIPMDPECFRMSDKERWATTKLQTAVISGINKASLATFVLTHTPRVLRYTDESLNNSNISLPNSQTGVQQWPQSSTPSQMLGDSVYIQGQPPSHSRDHVDPVGAIPLHHTHNPLHRNRVWMILKHRNRR